MANNFLPFCPTDTGTNLLTQGDYAAAADRTVGNQSGVASSKLVNKAIRQSAFISSQFAQYVNDKTGADLLDDANSARLLAQINAAMLPIASVLTKYTSGSTTHNALFWFFIGSGSATAGATYTNNGITYTVAATVASGTKISMRGNGVPAVSGTLTKSGGTGDSTLTFYAFRAPRQFRMLAVGGGSGGQGSLASGSPTSATAGGNTTIGVTLLVANGGTPGSIGSQDGGTPGSASIGTGVVGYAYTGNAGTTAGQVNSGGGGVGGAGYFGNQGAGGIATTGTGGAAGANTGSGGGGGGGGPLAWAAGGGASGGRAEGVITADSTAYAYSFGIVVGSAGSAGAAGTNGFAGGNGGSGFASIWEDF